ncbi:uncharacterized protein LOC115622835 [Scaptodrosophila lebanonensis]|uniref:Uncharacterized protein LOC115622835 n=1 Tax=Drosophila lebanonensis TaxID=7225 RepID=A0A6J2T9S3_DROLE|nr:uncharacterized protein LOC115622835 [Scaptodrosophila lebanonensis]XP_030372775.1 uncharacterized protein LOC115622835 [Scaptodrosophila lebanonensis]
MHLLDLLSQVCVNIFDIFKIYLKFAFITLVIYFVAEWYVLRYGAELEAQLDAAVAAEARGAERPAANSTLNKVYRFILNFLIA